LENQCRISGTNISATRAFATVGLNRRRTEVQDTM